MAGKINLKQQLGLARQFIEEQGGIVGTTDTDRYAALLAALPRYYVMHAPSIEVGAYLVYERRRGIPVYGPVSCEQAERMADQFNRKDGAR